MLYSIFIGSHDKTDKNDWKVMTDEQYNYDYFTCESIKQRIRLWKHTPNTLEEHAAGRLDSPDIESVSYDLADNTFYSNNYKNMSIMLMRAKKGLITNDTVTDAVYITLFNKDYKLLRYKVLRDSDNIVQTYRKKDEYQGCVIGCCSSIPVGSAIMELDVIDHTNDDKFTKLTLVNAKHGWIKVESSVYTKKDHTLTGLSKKFSNRTLSFKMTVKEGTVPTNTFITTEQHYAELESILQEMRIGENQIVVLSGDDALEYLNEIDTIEDCDNIDADSSMIHKFLYEATIDNRVRAITTYKFDLPYKFCKIYKILYLFKLDSDGKVTCLRSN